MIRLIASGASTFGKCFMPAISSVSPVRDEADEAVVLGRWRARVLETRWRREPPPRSPPL
jgi:hypothetical protein